MPPPAIAFEKGGEEEAGPYDVAEWPQVWDPDWTLDRYLNGELVEHRALGDDEAADLRSLVHRHAALTGSARALSMLDYWNGTAAEFRVVVPRPEVAAITRKNEGTRAARG